MFCSRLYEIGNLPVRPGLVAGDAGDTAMGAVELERRRVLEFGNQIEGMRLSVTGATSCSKSPLMHVPVTALAPLV